MTKKDRRKIYEQALYCIGDDNREGVCSLLNDIAWRRYHDDEYGMFPEFDAQNTGKKYSLPRQKIYAFWWRFTPEGNQGRRIALMKAMELTK